LKFLQSFCVVDSSLRILWVGGDWDDFALRNGGLAILSGDVLATRLTHYITDIDTADAVEKMVSAVIRTQGILRMDYRCDAPHQLRRFRLTIKPMKNGRAIMVHELRDAVQLNPPMDSWSFDPAARARKCSVCGTVHQGDSGWIDPTQAGGKHPRLVTYTTCPDCAGRIQAAVDGLVKGAEAAEVGELSLTGASTRQG
jgi:rubredoxin